MTNLDSLPNKKPVGNPNWVKGISGNPLGKGIKSKAWELEKALRWAKRKKGTSFLKSFVLRSYEDPTCAVALAKKLLPDLSQSESKDIIRTFLVRSIKEDTKPLIKEAEKVAEKPVQSKPQEPIQLKVENA